MFGILARNFIVGQGRYRPENEKPLEKQPTPMRRLSFTEVNHKEN